MKHSQPFKRILASCALLCASTSYADNSHPFYVAVDAGIFQATFNQAYRDKTDVISQNIIQSIPQQGYTEGLALGYSRTFQQSYTLGIELSENIDSHQASFASGASSSSFTDTTTINNHIDAVFVPGIWLNDTTTAYLKLGLSYASLQDNLNSPVGYIPTNTRYTSNQTTTGFAGGIGVKKYINERMSLFVEGNYHDYGVAHFSDFENFTATYGHSAHVYSYSATVGAAVNI